MDRPNPYYDTIPHWIQNMSSTTELLGSGSQICIPITEYNFLVQASKEFGLLQEALCRGGLDQDTLKLHIGNEKSDQRKDSGSFANASDYHGQHPESFGNQLPSIATTNVDPSFAGPQWRTAMAPPYAVQNGLIHPKGIHGAAEMQDKTNLRDWRQSLSGLQPDSKRSEHFDLGRSLSCLSVQYDADETADSTFVSSQNGAKSCDEKYTLFITGLSDHITYADLTSAIRGGRVLEILISSDRTAKVTMVEGAEDFLKHVKRHDLYVRTKRLEVSWAERQFVPKTHMLRKLAGGASRNIIIRNGANVVDEDEIRCNMEHIHQLIIIDIVARGRDRHIFTNSVSNAIFARTCMMSRQPYRRLKVEFFDDECAMPLPVFQRAIATVPKTVKHSKAPTKNLFDLRRSEDGDESGNEEDHPPGRRVDDDDSVCGSEVWSGLSYFS